MKTKLRTFQTIPAVTVFQSYYSISDYGGGGGDGDDDTLLSRLESHDVLIH
jgi:hypothetical protein